MAMSAGDYRQLGLSYRQQALYPEAIAAFQKAVALEPDNLDGRVLLGWTLHQAGRRAQAASELLETLYRNPLDVPAANALGIVYLVEGHLLSAVVTHTWAEWLKPDNEIAHYNLSLAYQRLQMYEPAIAHAMEAAKLEPSNPHPLVALAIAQWDRGDRVKAQQTYRQAIEIDGRYQDTAFLTYLDEAGFSPGQIERSQQVLKSLK
jgi:tetratricopeptide (TPR) repeat protein